MAQQTKKFTTFAGENETANDMGQRKETTYVVQLNTGALWCFGSLSAIYEHLTADDIGVKLEALWYSKLAYDEPFSTGKATITKTIRHSKEHKRTKQPVTGE